MTEKFRPNAGIVVFRDDKKVLVCKRNNESSEYWQFPQGGIDSNETPIQAAYRELKEETNITSVKLIKNLKFPITYRYPPEVLEYFKKKGRQEIGQQQYWTLFYFYGSDNEIDFCTNPEEIEFSDYRWIDIKTAPQLVWDPKKAAYRQMVEIFSPVIESWKNVL